MDNIDEFVERYVTGVTLDDPALLCIEDMWPWHEDRLEERTRALTAIQARAGEMKRFKPGEELAWIKTLSARTSEWMLQHARKGPTSPYIEPNLITVRHTSALGAFLALASQVEVHLRVHENTEQDLLLAARTLVLSGVPFGATHPHLQNAYRQSQPLQDVGEETFARALADFQLGKSNVPPYVAACVVKYPTIWRRIALDFRHVVMRRKYQKMGRHLMITYLDNERPNAVLIEPDMLQPLWTPEAVIAMDAVWSYRHMKKEHRRTFDTDYARLCIEFLKELELWEAVAKMLAEEEQYHGGPIVLEDCGGS